MKTVALLLLGCAFLGTHAALAEDALVGKSVTPRANVPVRSSPPSGVFLRPGAKVANAKPGAKYEILGKKKIQGLFYTDTWIKLKTGRGPPGGPTGVGPNGILKISRSR